jgi:replicative superfamily II helicase
MVTLIRAVADRYQATTIYKQLRELAKINLQEAARLTRFARDQYSRRRGILWTSQIRGLDRLLDSSSFALCTPTGSGKTLVANLALIKELLLPDEGVLAPLACWRALKIDQICGVVSVQN